MARIRHLAILTEDVDKLVKFYTNCLWSEDRSRNRYRDLSFRWPYQPGYHTDRARAQN